MENKPLVSVIIPTRNSAKTLDICLASVKQQSYPNIELIVVDNYSTDDTRRIAERYGAKVLLKGPERGAQRNYGARNARGKYLFFLDSDIEITQRVIEECIGKIEKNYVDAVVIPEVFVGKSFWAKCKSLEKLCYISKEINYKIEAARFFSSNVFWKLGGYDETIVGIEDWDLPQRMIEAGFRMSKIDSLMIHHEGKLTLVKAIRKAFYYAKNSSSYLDKARGQTMRHIILSRFIWLRRWRLLMRDPVHMVGMLFMKICEFLAAFFGYMHSKLS